MSVPGNDASPDNERRAASFGSQALDDVWAVIDRQFDQISEATFAAADEYAAPPGVLGRPGDEAATEQRALWRVSLRAARQGDWVLHQRSLVELGSSYAARRLSAETGGELFAAFTSVMIPRLVAAYGTDPPRLSEALQAVVFLAARGRRITASAYDDQRQAEFHAREDDLAITLDSIGDAVIVTDGGGRVVRMNPVAERLTGFTLEESRGRALEGVFRIAHETTGEPVESPVPRVLREGVVVGLANHTVLIARDGTRCPIADSGAPIRSRNGDIRGVVLVFRDVSEERRAEEALRHWERIFQHATWGVALADTKEVRFRAVNPAYAAMHGYTVEELVGAPVATLWAPGTRADMERHASETHDHGQLVAETTHVRKDGTTLPVEVVATTIKDASGAVAWFVANVQDITERKRLQQSRVRAIELEARNRRIEEANRLKSEFLANMSHELRTPLNSIIGFTELLHDEQVGAVSPKQKEFLDDILTGGRHLLRLINDVLDLAKVEAGKMEFRPEPVELFPLVTTVVQSLRSQALGKDIQVSTAVDPTLTDIVLDPGRFKQVLYNYLSNALKFTPERGRVDIRAFPEGHDRFRLEVEDTGPGIPADQASRLFVAFEQLEATAAKRLGGTGLGLALTRRLAEAQGGTVGVRNAASGSVFFVVLPRQLAGGGLGVIPRATGPRPTRVLVIEPEVETRESVVGALLDAGYEVHAAATAAQARRLLEEAGLDAVIVSAEELRLLAQDSRRPDALLAVALIVLGSGAASKLADRSVMRPVDTALLLSALGEVGVAPPHGRPVLVVDDDLGSLRLMEATLDHLGYQSVCCADGHEALALLQRLRPAAIIVDIIMPNMDGLAFLEKFRASKDHREVPVMLWTVKDLSAVERSNLQSSVDVLVQKGVGDTSRLAAALKSFLPKRPAAAEQGLST